MRRRAFSRPKDAGQSNDDALATSRAANRYALCDGASACYAGGAWARILCRQYVRDPIVSPVWIQNARAKFCATALLGHGDWLAQIAFARGSFSTLLGFTIHEDRVEGLAIGDSVLFIQTPSSCMTIPTMKAGDFNKNPVLLSSHSGKGALADTQEALSAAAFVVGAPSDGWSRTRFFAITDALAEWVLADQDRPLDRLSLLAALPHQIDFSILVESEISNGRMRYDDATVLLVEL